MIKIVEDGLCENCFSCRKCVRIETDVLVDLCLECLDSVLGGRRTPAFTRNGVAFHAGDAVAGTARVGLFESGTWSWLVGPEYVFRDIEFSGLVYHSQDSGIVMILTDDNQWVKVAELITVRKAMNTITQ